MNDSAREIDVKGPADIGEDVLLATEPVVMRGLVADWPAVQAGRRSARDAADYVRQFYAGRPVTASYAPASIKGRVGYTDAVDGFNFEAVTVGLDEFFERLFSHIDFEQRYIDRWQELRAGAFATDHLHAIIDFGCMAMGDPACDLTIAWTFFKGESRRVFRDRISLDREDAGTG